MTKTKDELDREYRTKWDVRVRERNRLDQEDSLPDLSDQAVSFAEPQPALGTFDKLPGCNCQMCRKR